MTSALVSSRISTVRATVELIRWSLIRNAINAPLFAVVQVLLAVRASLRRVFLHAAS